MTRPTCPGPRRVRAALVLAAALALLAACGTKGQLDCPPGTEEHIDGTCRPVAK